MADLRPQIDTFKLDVHRDSTDFRDRIYEPALIPLKREIVPKPNDVTVLDQGREGACTGFGLAAVINFLNKQRLGLGIIDDAPAVSARMLYEMARRYDRWPGENYEGSSARGVMKGWHKHGVCPEADWKYEVDKPGSLTAKREQRALQFPLGAYYRVQAERVEMQAALNEVGAILATAKVHAGWETNAVKDGLIRPNDKNIGGHAFAIIGYTNKGFIVQNSWGDDWGGYESSKGLLKGCAIWTYEDFEENLMDAWVARMALPMQPLKEQVGDAIIQTSSGPERSIPGPDTREIRLHYLHIDDGQFDSFGKYASDEDQLDEVLEHASKAEHILLYAHGGLNSVNAAASRARKWRDVFKRNGIHEIHFIWETGWLEELRDVLLGKEEDLEARVGGRLSSWWDRLIEKKFWFVGNALWFEMISDAEMAFDGSSSIGSRRPAGVRTLNKLSSAIDTNKTQLHLAGHSAGSIWHAHLLDQWSELDGPAIENLFLFAPACTYDLFDDSIAPHIEADRVRNFSLFNLDDQTEQDDTVLLYRKSLLYLLSNSFQKRKYQLNGPSIPILGMEKYYNDKDARWAAIGDKAEVFNTKDHPNVTASSSHGGFDDDLATMNQMLKSILGDAYKAKEAFKQHELD